MAKDLYVKARLQGGVITVPAVLSGPLQAQAKLGQTVKEYVHDPEYEGAYTVTPSETVQTLETDGLLMIDDVTVEAIPDSYVGSGIPVRGPSDMYTDEEWVYAPAGYYPNLAARSVNVEQSCPKPTITVDEDGLITATETISSGGYYGAGMTNSRTRQLSKQASKTVTPSDVEQTAVTAGKFTTGDVKVGPIPYTKHEIYFGFADETEVIIPVYCSDAVLTEMITGYTPTTYGGKEVILAQFDGVTWYEPSTETFETLYNSASTNLEASDPYPYFWISDLADVTIAMGSRWRITFDGTEYLCTVAQTVSDHGPAIGNPKYNGDADDGSSVPFVLFHTPWGAWSGAADSYAGNHSLKIERAISS